MWSTLEQLFSGEGRTLSRRDQMETIPEESQEQYQHVPETESLGTELSHKERETQREELDIPEAPPAEEEKEQESSPQEPENQPPPPPSRPLPQPSQPSPPPARREKPKTRLKELLDRGRERRHPRLVVVDLSKEEEAT